MPQVLSGEQCPLVGVEKWLLSQDDGSVLAIVCGSALAPPGGGGVHCRGLLKGPCGDQTLHLLTVEIHGGTRLLLGEGRLLEPLARPFNFEGPGWAVLLQSSLPDPKSSSSRPVSTQDLEIQRTENSKRCKS